MNNLANYNQTNASSYAQARVGHPSGSAARLSSQSHRCLWWVTAALLSAAMACGSPSPEQDAGVIDASPAKGTFSFSWSISDGSSALECGDIGALSVSIALVQTGGFIGTAEAFNCATLQGTSLGIDPGNYQFTIDLRASGGRSLLDEKIIVRNVEIVSGQNVELSAQEFIVAPDGIFSFFVDGNAAAGNCDLEASGGAEIAGLQMELRDVARNCVPTEFVVSPGSQAGGTFVNDCSGQVAAMPCIGEEQQITVTTRSGEYQLVILADKPGPIPCYEKVSGFTLAGAGLTTELGTLGLNLEFSEECDPNFTFPDGGLADAGVDASI